VGPVYSGVDSGDFSDGASSTSALVKELLSKALAIAKNKAINVPSAPAIATIIKERGKSKIRINMFIVYIPYQCLGSIESSIKSSGSITVSGAAKPVRLIVIGFRSVISVSIFSGT